MRFLLCFALLVINQLQPSDVIFNLLALLQDLAGMSLIHSHILLDQQNQQLRHQNLLSICELIIIQDKKISCGDGVDVICKMIHDMIKTGKETGVKSVDAVQTLSWNSTSMGTYSISSSLGP